jgi:hypothetical protein
VRATKSGCGSEAAGGFTAATDRPPPPIEFGADVANRRLRPPDDGIRRFFNARDLPDVRKQCSFPATVGRLPGVSAMYEIYGLQRKIESLEMELHAALERLDRIESELRMDELKLKRLEREVEQEQRVIERIEHELPGHNVPIGL